MHFFEYYFTSNILLRLETSFERGARPKWQQKKLQKKTIQNRTIDKIILKTDKAKDRHNTKGFIYHRVSSLEFS